MTKESFKASVYKHRIDIIVIASLLLLSLIVLLITGIFYSFDNSHYNSDNGYNKS